MDRKDTMDRKEIWSLRSSYKDGDPESCGVFDSPRAMAVGLARCVHGDHQKDSRDDLVDIIALAVFDMFYGMDADDEFVSDECRDGNTDYSYEIDEVQSIGLDETLVGKEKERKEKETRDRTGDNEYYFTFAFEHPLTGFVQQVIAPDPVAARRGMSYFYADCWLHCYQTKSFLKMESDSVTFIGGVVMKKLPRKIIVDGDKIYSEQEAKA